MKELKSTDDNSNLKIELDEIFKYNDKTLKKVCSNSINSCDGCEFFPGSIKCLNAPECEGAIFIKENQ